MPKPPEKSQRYDGCDGCGGFRLAVRASRGQQSEEPKVQGVPQIIGGAYRTPNTK
ncbi:uncharacterized protein An08g11460 [Aspergillus niger]|uniref:Contig An08c0290, genomic contig n=2 Tax=Aspergillus niger TaxID=5061 RepID=A2QSP5_ASPNC|nr:uncharacterized protein An08g11460 [Aspergillus niger]CAK45817.1 unnamed protein product [Aspergillus niger]